MKKYHEFIAYQGPYNETEKAFELEFSGGYTNTNNFYEWFPKSICIYTEPNEIGNFNILIPVWLFTTKRLDVYRCLMPYVGVKEL